MSDEEENGIWIRSAPSVDGSTYVVELSFNQDRSIVLDPTSAHEYASAVLTTVQYAEYDGAIIKQMLSRDLEMENAIQLIADMRKDRPEVDFTKYAPFSLAPGVNGEGISFIVVKLDGEVAGQWTLEDARDHARTILEAVIAADLDTLYFKVLRNLVNLEEEVARNVVDDLVRFR